ncbi:MAG: NUDIX hydrolase [Nanoarchaeota archaeon]
MDRFPKVGVGVIIIKDNKVLFGQRKNSHGEDTWSVPGGHLEFNESIEECAKREVFEETGIEIKNLKIGPFTNDIFKEEEKHYITIYVVADYDSGEVKVKEPDRMIEWSWFSWDNLPNPLFKPIENLLKQNFNPLI